MKERRNVRGVLYAIIGGKVEFLLLHARKGYWQFVQGGIEKGESEVEALQREILEETGLSVWKRDIKEVSKVSTNYYATRDKEPILVMLSAYAVEIDPSKEIVIGRSGDAHLDYQWVSLERARNLLTEYKEQMEVFDKICNLMKFK